MRRNERAEWDAREAERLRRVYAQYNVPVAQVQHEPVPQLLPPARPIARADQAAPAVNPAIRAAGINPGVHPQREQPQAHHYLRANERAEWDEREAERLRKVYAQHNAPAIAPVAQANPGLKEDKEDAEQWQNLTPFEREMIVYNRQLAEYNEAVQRNQYIDMAHQQQQNQQQNIGAQMGNPMPPVMLDNLAMMMQGENMQYIPVRPRRNINERIMRNFDPNLFNPEFIPEEENGH